MISRYLVIALSFGAAAYRFYQGAVVEALGLVGLGLGLLCLKLAFRWPALKRVSVVGFGITAVAMLVALYRIWVVRASG